MTTTMEPGAELAEVAAAGLGEIATFDETGSPQPALVEEGDKVSFLGMRAEVERGTYAFRDDVTLIVKGRVIFGPTEEEMADGHVRRIVKIRVSSVTPQL